MRSFPPSFGVISKQFHTDSPKESRTRPTPFSRKASQAKISKKLKDRSLDALKELLSKEKKLADAQQFLSASLPGHAQTQVNFSILAAPHQIQIDKLDPSAQVMQLFDKMVDSLIFIERQGIEETSFFLDGDPFTSSIFSGSQITLTEYSTAPKVFNIQFSGSPAALSLFEAHAASLAKAFEEGNFSFGVHRIETKILERERPLNPEVESSLDKEKGEG